MLADENPDQASLHFGAADSEGESNFEDIDSFSLMESNLVPRLPAPDFGSIGRNHQIIAVGHRLWHGGDRHAHIHVLERDRVELAVDDPFEAHLAIHG